MRSIDIDFDVGSWALGVLCATIYFGHLSAWWLLAIPVFVISGPWTRQIGG